MTECAAEHPDVPGLACTRPTPCFLQHQVWGYEDGTQKLLASWPNPNQPPTSKPRAGGIKRKATAPAGPRTAGTPQEAWDEHVQRPTRPEDPQTSHDAAGTTLGELRESQAEVLGLFRQFGAMTDTELIATARTADVRQSVSGLRTRRSELVDMGYLEDSGERGLTENERATIRWRMK